MAPRATPRPVSYRLVQGDGVPRTNLKTIHIKKRVRIGASLASGVSGCVWSVSCARLGLMDGSAAWGETIGASATKFDGVEDDTIHEAYLERME